MKTKTLFYFRVRYKHDGKVYSTVTDGHDEEDARHRWLKENPHMKGKIVDITR